MRKFSALAVLDVENIPAEKEAKVKEQIVSKRIGRNAYKFSFKLIKALKFVYKKTTIFSKTAYNKLLELKDKYNSETVVLSEDKVSEIKKIMAEVDEFKKKEDLEVVEKKLISIIGLDSQNIEAFECLGNLYLEKKNLKEAKEIFLHILKLLKNGTKEKSYNNLNKIASIYYNLSVVAKLLEVFDDALINIKKAIKIEPKNPRYLDTMLEISIINKDSLSALEAFNVLKEVNPENQKLKELKKQIDQI